MIHSVLERQLKKVGMNTETLPADLASWTALLERISRAYEQGDQERYLLERSLSLASAEMQKELTERKRAEDALRQAHGNLEQQNRQLERVHELLRSAVEQMMTALERGARADELMNDLRLVKAEFERLEKPGINNK